MHAHGEVEVHPQQLEELGPEPPGESRIVSDNDRAWNAPIFDNVLEEYWLLH